MHASGHQAECLGPQTVITAPKAAVQACSRRLFLKWLAFHQRFAGHGNNLTVISLPLSPVIRIPEMLASFFPTNYGQSRGLESADFCKSPEQRHGAAAPKEKRWLFMGGRSPLQTRRVGRLHLLPVLPSLPRREGSGIADLAALGYSHVNVCRSLKFEKPNE